MEHYNPTRGNSLGRITLLWVSAISITLSWSLPAKAGWKNSEISHANSKLTIISDTFNVSKISAL